MRYSDRHCYRALLGYVRAYNAVFPDRQLRLFIPDRPSLLRERELALQRGVALARPAEKPAMIGLERVPSCYGGGVRPFMCSEGETGHETIPWWPTAGLGPARMSRGAFIDVVNAVAEGLRMAHEAREEVS